LGEGAGGRTALPIVGEFYSQILHKSKFQNMRSSSFESPSEENLALLNVPPYRDVLEVTGKGFLRNLFGKGNNVQKQGQKEQQKTTAEQAEEPAKTTQEAEKKPFWQSMKEIFKKKSK
jgi:hypothetical protein